MAFAILYRHELKEYDFGPGHAFRGDRYEAFPRFLQENIPEDDNYRILAAEGVEDDDLLRICRKNYINFTRDFYKAANSGLEDLGDFFRAVHGLISHCYPYIILLALIFIRSGYHTLNTAA